MSKHHPNQHKPRVELCCPTNRAMLQKLQRLDAARATSEDGTCTRAASADGTCTRAASADGTCTRATSAD
eukprot:39461-Chlamydomonas_euryale.AAC.1